MKLPEKKYVPKHNDELRNYARGWNGVVKIAPYWISIYGDELTMDYLLEEKERVSKRKKMPFYEGWYDCIVEIEKLNAEDESEYRLDNFFQDSLEALDKLKVERKR